MTDPTRVLTEARELALAGRYEEALGRHQWYHDHALEHEPAQCGVRLSFALRYWADLGEVYPPARDALVAVRDRDAAAVRAGDWSRELFGDVASIDRYLGEEAHAGDLFLALHRCDPLRAGPFYEEAEPGLVALREYAVCSHHVPDPAARLGEMAERRRDMLREADDQPEDEGAVFREVVEAGFAEEAGRLIEILAGAGRRAEAERIRELALDETENEAGRAALSGAGGGP
jgi:hypothetical protein